MSRPLFRHAWVAACAVAAACALLALPALARAATITYGNGADGAVVYGAAPGETLNTYVGFHAGCGIDGGGNPLDCVTFYGNAVEWSPSENCQAQSDGTVWCLLDPDRSGVRILGGDGGDIISVFDADLGGFPAAAGYALAIDGGAGNDTLDGGSGPETIHGGPGADKIGARGGSDALYGDDGNDIIYGDGMTNGNEGLGGGDDQIYGGAGDDVLIGDTHESNAVVGHDLLDGGPGTDTVKDDWYRYDGSGGDEDPPPTVTFDGVANDGRPGENDNVLAVERVESGSPAGAVPATFVGDDGPNTFMLPVTNGVVDGRGGNDAIAGSDYADRLEGGPGDDQISGGFGDDAITGGPGRDDISGDRTAACEYGPIFGTCTIGSGNDTIYAQDGEADNVDCGPGADTAQVDAIDTVVNCESTRVAATPAGGGGKPSGKRVPAAKVIVSQRQLAAIARHRALVVVCRLPRAGRCAVRATISARVARALGLKVGRRAKAYQLAVGAARLRKPGHRAIRLPLSRRVVKALRRARSVTVGLRVTATYGKTHRATVTRVTLR